MIEPFYRLFPDPVALANAGPDLELMLRPLGFATQRAGQLRALGDRLRDAKGVDPGRSWADLPGIGAYASGMVEGALGAPGAAAVDTNIARIVERLYGVKPSHAEARKSPNIWSLVADLTKGSKSAIRVLWALLDLAAIVCKVGIPDCDACPLHNQCQYAIGRTPSRPGPTAETLRVLRGR
jgi:A/G-specific adenine glycosylase